jgi:hypothetical protein
LVAAFLNSNLNKVSANEYISVFSSMMLGAEYRRNINTFVTKFYLEGIENDYGTKQLFTALFDIAK